VECLQFLRELVDAGVVPTDVVTYERDRPIRQLAQERASLAFGGSYDASALADAAGVPKADLLDEFGFVGIPAGPRGDVATLAGGMAYAIFRQAKRPELAMRLLREVSSTEALAQMSSTTWQLAPRRTAIDRAASRSPFLNATGVLLEQAVVRPVTSQYARVSAQIQAMLEAVLTGRLTGREASARAAEMIAAITSLPVVDARAASHASRTAVSQGSSPIST
jgi:multiple sugar transport system substrate-binding protein